jgi:hypothetical protein
MNPRLTALLAVVATGCGATVLGGFTTTPEVITQLIVGITAFLASGIVVFVLFCTPWMRSLSPERQRRAIWFAAATTGVIVCFLPLAGWLFSKGPPRRTLTIRTYIDGRDTLKVQGSRIWYEHEEHNLPGDPGSRNEPTLINGRAWFPRWQGPNSVAFEGLVPAFQPRSTADVKLTKLAGRGAVTLREMPTAGNNRTLSIYFRDEEPGADWYDVVVEWK